MVTGECIKQNSMHQRRSEFNISIVGSRIYVSGGEDPINYYTISQCEVFDVLSGTWSRISRLKDPYLNGFTTVSSHKRYLITIGGFSRIKLPADNIDVVQRYDCLKDKKGWQTIHLKNPDSYTNGCDYGVIPMGLATNSDTLNDFLILGGNNGGEMQQMKVLQIDMDNFS